MEKNNYIEIKNSKFYGYLKDVTSQTEVENFLNTLKTEHKKATHITYAYILDSPQKEKCSDDKEPKGTAGLPILTALKRKNKTNVVLVVVRYFGGIKLGGGGLIRAYSKTANDLLNGD